MEGLYMAMQGLFLIVAVIAGIALHDFRKRRNDEFESVQAKNGHQRKIRKIELTLAAAVIVTALLFIYQPDSMNETQADDQQVSVEADEPEYPEGVYGPGTYKVGTDILAGEYKLTAEKDDTGYYEVKTDMSSDGGIESNSLFKGNEYVVVRDGEYLSVNRATFTLAN